MVNPYISPQPTTDERPGSRSPKRVFALLITIAAIVVPALIFTFLFRVPLDQKPNFFFRMLSGPFAGFFFKTRFRPEPVTAAVITVTLMTYTMYPRWFTLLLTLVIALLWFGAGVVAATGGV